MKREPSEVLYEKQSKAAKIALRRMLAQIGIWGVLGALEALVFAERERRYRKNPDDPAIDDLQIEEALAQQLATFLEMHVDWRRRRLEKP